MGATRFVVPGLALAVLLVLFVSSVSGKNGKRAVQLDLSNAMAMREGTAALSAVPPDLDSTKKYVVVSAASVTTHVMMKLPAEQSFIPCISHSYC